MKLLRTVDSESSARVKSRGQSATIGEEIPKLRDGIAQKATAGLAQLADIYNDIEALWPGLLSELEPFYIQARYPDYRGQMKRVTTKERAESILVRTRGLLRWLLQRINSAKS